MINNAPHPPQQPLSAIHRSSVLSIQNMLISIKTLKILFSKLAEVSVKLQNLVVKKVQRIYRESVYTLESRRNARDRVGAGSAERFIESGESTKQPPELPNVGQEPVTGTRTNLVGDRYSATKSLQHRATEQHLIVYICAALTLASIVAVTVRARRREAAGRASSASSAKASDRPPALPDCQQGNGVADLLSGAREANGGQKAMSGMQNTIAKKGGDEQFADADGRENAGDADALANSLGHATSHTATEAVHSAQTDTNTKTAIHSGVATSSSQGRVGANNDSSQVLKTIHKQTPPFASDSIESAGEKPQPPERLPKDVRKMESSGSLGADALNAMVSSQSESSTLTLSSTLSSTDIHSSTSSATSLAASVDSPELQQSGTHPDVTDEHQAASILRHSIYVALCSGFESRMPQDRARKISFRVVQAMSTVIQGSLSGAGKEDAIEDDDYIDSNGEFVHVPEEFQSFMPRSKSGRLGYFDFVKVALNLGLQVDDLERIWLVVTEYVGGELLLA